MSFSLIFAAAAASTAYGGEIIVTASLAPVALENAAVSATVIDESRIEALGQPLAIDLFRLVPGVAVSVSGARGSQSEVRIRGAEARHSLLFIDGIAFNEPAAANAARFEMLATEALGRIEVVTGPQSALWGSEALGGVISLETRDPIGAGLGLVASGEYGSDDFGRLSAAAHGGNDKAGIAANVSWMRAGGIDILGGGNGDKDGYRNLTAMLKAIARPGEDGEIGIVGRYVDHRSAFDGSDPTTFLRADTSDESRTKTGAVRVWAKLGLDADAAWSGVVSGQYLDSRNRNFDDSGLLNLSRGSRFRVDGQLVRRFSGQTLIVRAEREEENYTTRDVQYGGFTNKDVSRSRNALVGEWRGEWGTLLTTSVAVRRDMFNRFADATTWRANAIARVTERLSLHGGYGEGIAQPSFVDLYGFFPGSFIGNPDVTVERSRGFELGLRWRGQGYGLGLTGFHTTLQDEILTVFDANFFATTANATGKSKRKGIELTADAEPLPGLRLSANYTWLKADELKTAGGMPIREARRPKHSANLIADYESGPLTLGTSLAYVGRRRDTDFDIFADVTLKSYVLASARVAYAITPAIEGFARVENLFRERYQDVAGYATPGRTVYAGLRVRLGD